jgi:hypothetical protein
MRSSIFFAAPFVAAAYAQSSSETNSTVSAFHNVIDIDRC